MIHRLWVLNRRQYQPLCQGVYGDCPIVVANKNDDLVSIAFNLWLQKLYSHGIDDLFP